ncbi:MAG: crossover junction endodeoxyribonuclease RuvC [Firmicutes bacterium]|mgnify:CR=1 FL=1|jgi:crossover junction endodeoxyribonuclease RuvC|nr:crossover junction endodeoxyribonuclease RuvC [Bacillota bacterium]HPU00439.1 crossover junction endodeoxyribonuclease RuvC [Bacillota bacterium]
MVVLGIDPGLAITGYGLVEEREGRFIRLASGCIRTAKDTASPLRLEEIFNGVEEIIRRYQPAAMVVEKLFFCKNVRTALQVGEARGTVILAAAKNRLPVFEYTPLQVKQAVAGYGAADKAQVQKMVQLLLALSRCPAVDDEADALAVALCHLQHRRYREVVEGSRRK